MNFSKYNTSIKLLSMAAALTIPSCILESVYDEELIDEANVRERSLASLPEGCSPEFESCAIDRWPGGRVAYKWTNVAGHPSWSSADKLDVRVGMDAWENATGGVIKFEEASVNETQFAQMLSEIGTGCNSPMGVSGGSPSVRLRQCGSGAIIHELGHLLGMAHTHKRADRDRYVMIDVVDFCSPPDPPVNHCAPSPPAEDAYCNYGTYTSYKTALVRDNVTMCQAGQQQYGAFDVNSLMLYASDFPIGCDATHLNLCFRTLRDGSADGANIPPRSQISIGDASAIIEMYREPGWRPFRPIYRADPSATVPLDLRLTSTVSVIGAPAIARWGSGVVAMARGSNKHFYVNYNSTGSNIWPAGSWTDVGGDWISEPAAVSWGTGRLDWVGIGTDGYIWHRAINNGTIDAGAESLGRPGTSTPSAPAIASWGANRLDVFVRDGQLIYQKTWTSASGWSGWTSRGGNYKGRPAAVSRSNGTIDLFGVGTDDSIYHKGYSGTWSPPENLGGAVALGTGPAAASMGGSHLNVYVRGSNGRLWHQAWTGTWSGWSDIGGLVLGSPAAVTLSNGKAYVVATISDNGRNGVWQRYWY